MMRKSAVALFAIGAALFSAAAAAQYDAPRHFYAGASASHSRAERWCLGASGGSCDDTNVAGKVFGGYQLDETFAVELGYTYLGKFKVSASGGGTDEAKVQALEASVVATRQFGTNTALFGRFGAYYAKVREDTSFAGSFSNNNGDLTFGAGVRYHLTPKLAVRAEWQRYLDVGGSNVALGAGVGDLSSINVYGVGFLYRL
jgi:OOP family OmpA-OmpF porin